MRPLYRSREGVCSRGWMFMGEQGGPCDKKCQMCYYAYQKNLVFFSLPTMIGHANLFRHYYGLDACDITGGEPTIYKDIVPLVAHCARIGLKPTIITHGQNNRAEFRAVNFSPQYKQIEDAGLDDWLISLHGGHADSHDAILGQAGSHKRLTEGVMNIKRPVRYNTTIQRENLSDLPDKWLMHQPPTVWNAIVFNPFYEWAEKTAKDEIAFQVRYREAADKLAPAIERLEAVGWEVNVRYFPLCVAEEFGFARNVSGYHQVPFDPWEWRLNVSARTPMEEIEKTGWYEAERASAAHTTKARMNEVCSTCSMRNICDKPPIQYQEAIGLESLKPFEGEVIEDPLHFMNKDEPEMEKAV